MQPLNELLQGHGTTKASKKAKKSSPSAWTWGLAQQNAFLAIKEKLLNPPVLAYADYNLPFIVHTDASSFRPGRSAISATRRQRASHSVR